MNFNIYGITRGMRDIRTKVYSKNKDMKTKLTQQNALFQNATKLIKENKRINFM
jgi:hypothetical protein